jgi:hypothetical protein
MVCRLPSKSPWLKPIEPKCVHGKRAVAEPARVLSTAELIQRVCAYYHFELTALIAQLDCSNCTRIWIKTVLIGTTCIAHEYPGSIRRVERPSTPLLHSITSSICPDADPYLPVVMALRSALSSLLRPVL